jgi:hypothetical protein
MSSTAMKSAPRSARAEVDSYDYDGGFEPVNVDPGEVSTKGRFAASWYVLDPVNEVIQTVSDRRDEIDPAKRTLLLFKIQDLLLEDGVYGVLGSDTKFHGTGSDRVALAGDADVEETGPDKSPITPVDDWDF